MAVRKHQIERDNGAAAAPLKVFISYSRTDTDFADQLVAALALCGFDTTIDRHEITGGEAWQERLGALIRDADTIAFVLSPASAASTMCGWEVAEAARQSKRILPVVCTPLRGAAAPPQLQDLNYIFCCQEAAVPGSGFGTGLSQLVAALNTDVDWIREHTRLLARASEWDKGGRAANRLLSGNDILDAKAWIGRRRADAPEPTVLHLEFIRASEEEEARRTSAEHQRLAEMASYQEQRAKALREKEEVLKANRLVRWLFTSFLFVAASALGGVAYYALGESNRATKALGVADEEKAKAEVAQRIAEDNLQQARKALSNNLLGLAQKYAEDGDMTGAVLVALEALPDPSRVDRKDWPFRSSVKRGLEGSLENLRESLVVRGSASFSPDGASILVVRPGTAPRILDAATGMEKRVLGPTSTSFDSAAFSPDGRRVLTGRKDGPPASWDAGSGALLVTFGKAEDRADKAVMTADGRYVVSAVSGKPPVVWDAQTGGNRRELDGIENAPTTYTLSPDGKTIWTATQISGKDANGRQLQTGRVIRLWNIETGKLLLARGGSTDLKYARPRFSPAGKYLLVDYASTTRVFDAATGDERFTSSGSDSIMERTYADDIIERVFFDQEDQTLLTLSSDRKVRVLDTAGRAAPAVLSGHAQPLIEAAFSVDGKLLVTVSADKAMLRDATSGTILHDLPLGDGLVNRAMFSPDGRLLMLAVNGRGPRLYDVATGRLVATLGETEVRALQFSPKGDWVVGTATDTKLNVWRVPSPVRLAAILRDQEVRPTGGAAERPIAAEVLGAARHVIKSAAFNRPAGDWLLTEGRDGTSRLWKIEAAKAEGEADAGGRGEPSKSNRQADTPATLDELLAQTYVSLSTAKSKLARCLEIPERVRLRIEPQPPRWCIESGKYPYDKVDWAQWPDNPPEDVEIAKSVSYAAGDALLDGDDNTALAAAALSLRFAPDLTWLRINYAHALMFTGDFTRARAQYLGNRGSPLGAPYERNTWEAMLLEDFKSLRREGRPHTDLMKEVEAAFDKPAETGTVSTAK